MRRRPGSSLPPPAVCVTLLLERSTVDDLDAAARLLGVSRQEVLLRGFALLTHAAVAVLGHAQHEPGCLDSSLIS
jgi:hypothetical protein